MTEARAPSRAGRRPPGALPLVECCPPLLERVVRDDDARLAAGVFKALADPARVTLLSCIASAPGGEACVCDLNGSLRLAQPTVSHHLKVMHDAGLLARERRGTWVYYRVRPEALDAIRRALA